LQAHTSKKVGNNSKGNFRGRGCGKNFRSSFKRNTQNQEQGKNDEDQSESSNIKGNFSIWREKKKKKVVDRKRIKCFNCNRIGHFSIECVDAPSSTNHRGNQSHSDYQAHMVKEENEAKSEEQPLILMMITDSESHNNEIWYIDFGC